jgi:hypothetical protein
MIPDGLKKSGIRRKACTKRRLGLPEDVLLFQRDISLPHAVMNLELGPWVIGIEQEFLATTQDRQHQQWRHDPRGESES